MNTYQKDAIEILDVPIAPSIGNNTLAFVSAVSVPAGLTFAVTVAPSGKTAKCLVSGGTFPNTYACKVCCRNHKTRQQG